MREISELPEMEKNEFFGLFRPNLPQLRLFHPYFVCKCIFREISMMKMVILNKNKQIWIILKNKNIKKFKNPKFVNCKFIIHKNKNKTSIQPILKTNSTSFLFNKIFCKIYI